MVEISKWFLFASKFQSFAHIMYHMSVVGDWEFIQGITQGSQDLQKVNLHPQFLKTHYHCWHPFFYESTGTSPGHLPSVIWLY